MTSLAAIGLSLHSGWASAVLMATTNSGKVFDAQLIQRRRFTLCEHPHSKQPYHMAENMTLREAEAFVTHCRAATVALAGKALAELREAAQGHQLAGAGIATSSFKKLPSLLEILRSHALIHAAEGAFYRGAVVEAAAQAGIDVKTIKSGAVSTFLAGTGARSLRAVLETIGKSAGPPWTMDEKAASLAALSLMPEAERAYHLDRLEETVS
jgi:hypothetical protein